MDRLWRSNSSISSKTGCPSHIVNEEDHNVEKHGASVLMCLHDAKSKNFKDNIFGMVNDYVKQLRVLNVLNKSFKVDLVPLYDEFMLSKNRIKRKYFQDNFAQSERDRVKRK